MKILVIFFLLTSSTWLQAQFNDTLPVCIGREVAVVDKDFIRDYNILKPRVLKVYPYAIYAANLIDEMNHDLESIEKRRKRTKYTNKFYKQLKADYKYVFLDMYTSEGKVLTKLVARETGLTIYEIVKSYKGQKDAIMFNLMGKVFEQDIKSKYNPQKEYVLEAIIEDIESGKITFDTTVVKVNKTTFKDKKKTAKQLAKANHKKVKANKKKNRKKKRKKKKDSKAIKEK